MTEIKEIIREMRGLVPKVTTSDLQGIAMVKAREIMGKGDMQDPDYRRKLSEAEDIILQYAYDDLDINSAKRYLMAIKTNIWD